MNVIKSCLTRQTALLRPLFAALLTAIACLSWVPVQAQEQNQPLDRIIAIVDDDVVLASELRNRLDQVMDAIQANDQTPPPMEQLQRDLLDRLVLESLQLQMAERAGVRISDDQLNESMGRIAAQNNLDLGQFAQALEQQGISYARAREQVRREMVLQRVQQGNVNQRIQITDQEIDNFLDSADGRAMTSPEYRVLHALLPASGSDADRVAELAERLRQRIAAGESFQDVLAGVDNPRPQGGDLGWRKADELPSLLADVVPTLNQGETGEVIRSSSGFHLLQLVGVRGRGETVEQTRARHILLKASAIRSEEETRQLAARLRQRALAGEDFAALAREFSEDIGSAREGGELGWTSPGQLVSAFQAAMDDTRVGEISEPVLSPFGWHIVLVEDRREQDVTDELRRNMAYNYLHQRKYEEELEAWLQKIRDEAYVDIKFQ